jgi:signal transduction histidine kinase
VPKSSDALTKKSPARKPQRVVKQAQGAAEIHDPRRETHDLLKDAVAARDRVEHLNRELEQRQRWQRALRESLEAAVNNASLEMSLGILVGAVVEDLQPDVRAAFHLVNEQGTALHHVVGMSKEFADAVDGFRIVPKSRTGDPLWEPWRRVAERFGYEGCWSFPIHTVAGKRVGTLAIYSRQPRKANDRDLELAALLTNTASIIIARHAESEERQRVDAALREVLKEAKQARAEAEEAGRAKDKFLAVLSHELRTPLTPIFMATRTLLRRKKLPQDIREGLAMIERNIGTEARMIDELLDLTRVAHGKLDLQRQRMGVVEALKNALDVAAPDIKAKKQKLVVKQPRGSAFIDGDSMRLEQAFWNVLKNASKFTPENGEIRVQSRRENGSFVIAISDTGAGIPAAALKSIFDPFTQADDSIAPRFGGLGLGLALARATIDGHGGSIVATSDGKDRGSTFTIRLPRCDPG